MNMLLCAVTENEITRAIALSFREGGSRCQQILCNKSKSVWYPLEGRWGLAFWKEVGINREHWLGHMKLWINHKSEIAQVLLKSNIVISYLLKWQRQQKIQMLEIKTNIHTKRNKTLILVILSTLLNEVVCAHGFHSLPSGDSQRTHSIPDTRWPVISDTSSITSTEAFQQLYSSLLLRKIPSVLHRIK